MADSIWMWVERGRYITRTVNERDWVYKPRYMHPARQGDPSQISSCRVTNEHALDYDRHHSRREWHLGARSSSTGVRRKRHFCDNPFPLVSDLLAIGVKEIVSEQRNDSRNKWRGWPVHGRGISLWAKWFPRVVGGSYWMNIEKEFSGPTVLHASFCRYRVCCLIEVNSKLFIGGTHSFK